MDSDPLHLPFHGHRIRSAFLALGAFGLLVALVASSHAALKPKVENPHGKFKADCALCHAAANWKPARISSAFNHATYGFPLSGAHATAKCMACHGSLDFSQNKQLCASCHQDPHRGEMGTECARCHSARSFTDRSAMVRAHQATRFPLTGSHAQIDCETCHKPTAQGKMQFVGTKAECQNCHMDQYRSTKNPDHVAGGFPTDCASCHTTLTWSTKTFDHDKTAFPLTGAHRTTACQSCHGDGVYKGKTTLCYACHKSNYDATTSPAHAASQFPTACVTCHNTTAWTGAVFDHSKTLFPLTGAHVSALCSSCHGDGVYKGKSIVCGTCHSDKYTATADPKHSAAGFSTTACETCHNTTAWTGATFNHNTATTFALFGAHIGLDCNVCHASALANNVFKGLSMACVTCHLDKYNATTSPVHTGFPQACESCHTTTAWLGAKFDHSLNTTFPLTGAHQALACNSCHGDGVYKGKSMLCNSCHNDKYVATTDPKHSVAEGFATTCETCHNTTVWTTSTFNHNTATTFQLTGAHVGLDCNGCHSDNVFKAKSTVCGTCHSDKYAATTDPKHSAAAFSSTACQPCHNTTAWTTSTFNHNTATTFALSGAHIGLDCNVCHAGAYANNVFKGLNMACVSCHLDKYNAATSPVHTGFPQACESCHTTTAWLGAKFDHTLNTTFPLTGAHPAVACSGCHGDGVYKGKSVLCNSCHNDKYVATTDPKHSVAAGFATTCESCHNTTAWTTSTFNHNTATTFALTGSHVGLDCNQCHGDNVFKGKSVLCYSCHNDKYTATTDPKHSVAGGFPTACESCHNTTVWTTSTFNHNTATTFALTGAHVALDCNGCHSDNVFKGKSTLCYDCHKDKYNATTSPVHTGFPQACESCHTTTAWLGAKFDHTLNTTFPLTGAHLAVACSGCHGDGVYKGKSMLCNSCHNDKYVATTDPKHSVAAGFPTTCETCHNTTLWTTSTFNHNTATTFPLTGAHVGLDCNGCHSDNIFKGKSAICGTCHSDKYLATTDPKHSAAAFSATACETCHNTTAWTTSTFNHTTATTFPLTGAHTTGDCNSCHASAIANNVFHGLSTLCYTCHKTEYGTTVVNHAAAGFPTTCETCHNTTAWAGATFNHDTFFPIYSGTHTQARAGWTACSDCHTNVANYAVWSCVNSTCHTNTATDSEHRNKPNAINLCYSCHPKGSAG